MSQKNKYKNIISFVLSSHVAKNGKICVTTSSDISTQKIKYVCLLRRCGQSRLLRL